MIQPPQKHAVAASLVLASTFAAVTDLPPAHAGIAFDFDGGTSLASVPGFTSTFGFGFTVTSPVDVDSLLLYDLNANGWSDGPVLVSIYPDDGTTTPVNGIQASFDNSTTNVFAGDAPPGGQWLDVDIANTMLPTGAYSVIAEGEIATSEAAPFDVINITPQSGLTYGTPRYALSGGNPTGDLFFNSNGYFAPNFTLVTNAPPPGNAVPEPATAGLLLLGLAAVGLLARRRRSA